MLKKNTDNITFRNHYNPCFWTALWNNEYYHAIKYSKERNRKPRDYKLKGIRFSCSKIITNKSDGLFFELNMGLVLMTIKELRDLYYKLPKDYTFISTYNKFRIKYLYWLIPKWGIIIDIERLFTELEHINGTRSVLDLVKYGKVIDDKHKSLIATFVYTHQLRSPITFSTNYNKYIDTNHPKAFTVLSFIHSLSNEKELQNVISGYMECVWHLFTVSIDIFPLPDLPIYEDKLNVIAVLSPRHLLIINKEDKEGGMKYHNSINKKILDTVYKKIIQNTFRDLVLENESVLNMILNSNDWKTRDSFLRSIRKTK